jgi:hypothetical protein
VEISCGEIGKCVLSPTQELIIINKKEKLQKRNINDSAQLKITLAGVGGE